MNQQWNNRADRWPPSVTPTALDTVSKARRRTGLSQIQKIRPTDFVSPHRIAAAQVQTKSRLGNARGIRYAERRRAGQFRSKLMKPRITINEMSREQPDVVLWRRFGSGGWFLVQTARLASDRRNQRLVRVLRGHQIRRPRMTLESRTQSRPFTP